tara:strand:+ start:93 stop:200 length:108 start_codon:yes stop_codon:yes gene_type:complete
MDVIIVVEMEEPEDKLYLMGLYPRLVILQVERYLN